MPPIDLDLYTGDKPYIFISYARKDSKKADDVILWLKRKGYRFWYDAALLGGSVWSEEIAERIDHSCCFIALISPNYVSSPNCREELHYAHHRTKVIPVFLEETELTGGMKMQIGMSQILYMYKDHDLVYGNLEMAEGMRLCLEEEPATAPAGRTGRPAKRKWWIAAAAAVLVLAAVALLKAGVFTPVTQPSGTQPSEAQPSETQPSEIPPSEVQTAGTYPSGTPGLDGTEVANLFDGNDSTVWRAKMDGDVYVAWRTIVPLVPNYMLWGLPMEDMSRLPAKYELYGKLNESDPDWEMITYSTEAFKVKESTRDANINIPGQTKKYQYFCLVIHSTAGSDYVQLSRIEIYETDITK